MKCNVCLSEIVEQSICPICGADIEIVLDRDNIKWQLIYNSNSLINAQMIKSNIESAEIPVFLFSKQDSVYPMSINDFSKVEIYVPLEYVNEAKLLLKDLE